MVGLVSFVFTLEFLMLQALSLFVRAYLRNGRYQALALSVVNFICASALAITFAYINLEVFEGFEYREMDNASKSLFATAKASVLFFQVMYPVVFLGIGSHFFIEFYNSFEKNAETSKEAKQK